MEKPPMSLSEFILSPISNKMKSVNRKSGGAGFKIPDDDDRMSLSSLLGEDGSGEETTDKIPFDVAYPKTHVHTPNPIEYEQMKTAMRHAEYERITREKEKQDWSELNMHVI